MTDLSRSAGACELSAETEGAYPEARLKMIDPSLPGADLVEQGLEDLRQGRETAPAMLVAMASERLRELGIDVPREVVDAHLRLYALLSAELGDGAHSRYNALRRRLISFLHAKACVR